MRKYTVWVWARNGQEPFGEFGNREEAEDYVAYLVSHGHRKEDLPIEETEYAAPTEQVAMDLPF